MNLLTETAVKQLLTDNPDLFALVAERVTWDDEEIDMPYPGLTLRALTTRFPASELRGRGGIGQALVEVTARATTRIGVSNLADAVVSALDPFQQGPTLVELSAGGSVQIGAIVLNDFQQVPSIQQQSYRKLLTYSISYYE